MLFRILLQKSFSRKTLSSSHKNLNRNSPFLLSRVRNSFNCFNPNWGTIPSAWFRVKECNFLKIVLRISGVKIRDWDTICMLRSIEGQLDRNTFLLTIKSQSANHSSLLSDILSGSDRKMAHSSKDNLYINTCRTKGLE